ncbi:Fatty acid desaturase [Mameliella alba]|uniref:fatty acid desaturase family protein n=1 Tax=Mameliella TaxID=1434019 RepID=UPI000885090B|nr:MULTISPECIES: fatty acid desaturase family protein [Mameliella]MCR9275145.1 fatty acid desaturase family protein [Paracoccaceae bacterium]OWV42484.1 fatty acid desaturase [Mameliella alba]OWV52434.1 fatty acid desaturase [Mameliella alba]PTR35750.1 fatty acid desaturase [Mameliella alba]SDE13108.1 Fatty acid desaturase [Mameliella alba]
MTPGKAFLTTEEIRSLSARSDLWGAALLLHCWALILGALAVFLWWPNALTFVLAVMVIGSRQLGLAILMHEAAHNALFKSRKLNEFAGVWLCGAPILADLASYRHYHLMHHRHTQTEQDPDLRLSKPFPTTRASLRRKLIRDITGQTGIKQRAAQVMFALRLVGETEGVSSQDLAQAFHGPVLTRALVANGVLFAVFWALGGWWLWVALWLLPLLTWFQMVLRIRNIAEHGAVEFSEDPLRNTRTTLAGPLERLFLAPYWVNYHLEHHLVMHVPAHNLPRLHAMLRDKGVTGRMMLAEGYAQVLRAASARTA